MTFSEANSDGAALRVSNQFDQPEMQGQTTDTALMFDWVSDYFKGQKSTTDKCLPSPLYDHALYLAKELYHNQALASKLNGYESKFDCLIKTDDDAVKYANEALHIIGDPYTRVLSKKQADELRSSIAGDKQITGIGVSLLVQKNDKAGGYAYPFVAAVFPGTSAEKAGLKQGDYIIQVGGQSTKDLPMDKVQSLLKGEEGSRVQLRIDRNGRTMDVFATRAKIEVPATLEHNFGDVHYIKLIDFMNDKTDISLKQSITSHPDAKAFIVDLRGNPGGRVEEMIETIGLLMNAGPIFEEQSRSLLGVDTKTLELTDEGVRQSRKGSSLVFSDNRNRYLLNGRPLVVLVDEFSASASELLAGALKDNGKALLVGNRTFGKGVGQQIIAIDNGSMVAVTNTKFINPGGHWSGDGNQHRIGIEPNVSVPSEKGVAPLSVDDKQFQRALEEARRLSATQIGGMRPAEREPSGPALIQRLRKLEPAPRPK